MAGWITVNGSHVFLKDGQSVEEALSERQAGTNQENHQAANDGIRKAFQKKKEKSQERAREVVNELRNPSFKLVDDRYETKTDKFGNEVKIDKLVLDEVNRVLVGKEFDTAYNGKVRLREEAPDLKGNEHIAKTAHELDVADISKIPEALKNPTHFIPKGGTIDNDTYILNGKFGEAKDKNYLYVHVGKDNKICEIKTAYVNEKLRGKYKKIIETFKKK